ncbi:MAG TPA: choice-of-anchor M domain-containing protein [Solirubrobacteraceae bacterium]|nr:choice-of-anchor M domain-containing protein [Solirubrobacteraceae bacterium]
MRLAVIAVACAGVLAPAAHAQAPVVLDDGHVDFGMRVAGDRLRAQIRDSTHGEPVWREPGDVQVRLDRDARAVVPAGTRFAFLGPPGATVWLIPQVQKAGVVWLGWNTEALSAADVDGPVTWRLTGVDGPGAVAVFQTGGLGQVDKLFDSGDGLPDARDVPLGTHAHGTWSFTQPGAYALHLEVGATRASGAVEHDAQVLRVLVDDTLAGAPPAPGPGDPGGTPPGTEPPPAGSGAAAPRLTLRGAGARGRRLTLRLTLSAPSRVRATLRRGEHVAARTAARSVRAGRRTVVLRLDRRPRRGRYVVRVSAAAGDRTTVRTRPLRIR